MITFVIPAYNEELLIGRTISALHSAAGAINEPYEIIVVDDASTDATTTVAARCGAQVLTVHHRQIAAARNAGAAQAQGDLLLFVDADTHVPSAVVGAAAHAMRGGAVGGGARARFDRPVPMYGRILAWLWLWIIQPFGHLASGCFLFCTRHAFNRWVRQNLVRRRGRGTQQATQTFGSIRDLMGGGGHVRAEPTLALRLQHSAYLGRLRTAWPRVL
jgi:glycosyltransferase involved in cell wall biosynthesis